MDLCKKIVVLMLIIIAAKEATMKWHEHTFRQQIPREVVLSQDAEGGDRPVSITVLTRGLKLMRLVDKDADGIIDTVWEPVSSSQAIWGLSYSQHSEGCCLSQRRAQLLFEEALRLRSRERALEAPVLPEQQF